MSQRNNSPQALAATSPDVHAALRDALPLLGSLVVVLVLLITVLTGTGTGFA